MKIQRKKKKFLIIDVQILISTFLPENIKNKFQDFNTIEQWFLNFMIFFYMTYKIFILTIKFFRKFIAHRRNVTRLHYNERIIRIAWYFYYIVYNRIKK